MEDAPKFSKDVGTDIDERIDAAEIIEKLKSVLSSILQ
jgi:hypothetical protein